MRTIHKSIFLSLFFVCVACLYWRSIENTPSILPLESKAPLTNSERKNTVAEKSETGVDQATQPQVNVAAYASSPEYLSATTNYVDVVELVESQLSTSRQPYEVPSLDDILGNCATAHKMLDEQQESNLRDLVRMRFISDTPESRASVRYVLQISQAVCLRIGALRAAKILQEMRDARNSHRSLLVALEDLVSGINSGSQVSHTNPTKVTHDMLKKILLEHDSPLAVEFALAKLFVDRDAVRDMRFFNAGKDVPNTIDRLALLPWVGVMHSCKVEPKSCLPGGYRTIKHCSSKFLCAPDRDTRYLVSSQNSERQMRAIDAMVGALIEDRALTRGK